MNCDIFQGKNITVASAYEEWLNSVANRVKESTYANYKVKFEKHILPEFSDTSVLTFR